MDRGTGATSPGVLTIMLDITETKERGIIILHPSGKLDTLTANSFEAHMTIHIENGTGDLLVDMEQVDYVSSFGLRSILIVAKKLAPLERKFVLFAPNPSVYEALRYSGFLNILTVTESKQAALAVVAPEADGAV